MDVQHVGTPGIEPSGEQTLGTATPPSDVRSWPRVALCTSITRSPGVARPCGGEKVILGPLALVAATLTPTERANCMVLISAGGSAGTQALPGPRVQSQAIPASTAWMV